MKRFASALSTNRDWKAALGEVAAQARAGLGGAPCDAAAVFVSAFHSEAASEALAAELIDLLAPKQLLGCCCSGVIGGDQESELEPALSVLAMSLPGVRITPFELAPLEAAKLESGAALVERLDLYPTEKPNFIVLADPMSCDIDGLLKLFNAGYPGCPVIGGLASGATVGRPNWLVLGPEAFEAGAVGLALSGDVTIETTVAQGCRPVGHPYTVTRADENVLFELAGKPALDALRDVVTALSPEDRELARTSLFVGLAMSERRDVFRRGDFLIRNLMGFDPGTGALVVGSPLRAGQTIQFQLRDAATSAEDLKSLLGDKSPGTPDRGALLFSCCGRGRGLYGTPHHDTRLIQRLRGPLPMAGFFANGEIGPVGGHNFIHGYTSSLAVIR